MDIRYVLVCCLAVLCLPMVSSGSETLPIVGWAEKVSLLPEGLVIRAKIDTGADHSSLNVPMYETFLKGGEMWVRFAVTNAEGHSVVFERRVERVATIKRRGNKSKRKREQIKRPVVKIGICTGGAFREVDVNLADRRKFKFPMLIGRSFLKGLLLVDASAQYSADPTCPGAVERE
jgi:hypothetical protein